LAVRYDDIGNRLKAFRLGSGLSADEIAKRAGISRTALYRFEKGEVVKIETIDKLAELLGVSVPTLLGVGVEYVPAAVSFFERIRQTEANAQHITMLAGPLASILASDKFTETVGDVLRESIPNDVENRKRLLEDVSKIIEVLVERKAAYRKRRPSVVNLISALEIERFARNGMVGRSDLPESVRQKRRSLAREELAHFARLVASEPMGIQIGIVPSSLSYSGFQIFRQPDREVLAVSPFRLGEHPNIRVGVAMITSAPEALALHQKVVDEMWKLAIKGKDAAKYLVKLSEANPRGQQPARSSSPRANHARI
jgi:transcriptional regulator with XRE-family HTH domain